MTRRPLRAPRRQAVGWGAVTVSGPRSGEWVGRAGGAGERGGVRVWGAGSGKWVGGAGGSVERVGRAFAGQVGVEPGCEVRIGLREFGQHATPEQRQFGGRG